MEALHGTPVSRKEYPDFPSPQFNRQCNLIINDAVMSAVVAFVLDGVPLENNHAHSIPEANKIHGTYLSRIKSFFCCIN
jgi:hypothetical protein